MKRRLFAAALLIGLSLSTPILAQDAPTATPETAPPPAEEAGTLGLEQSAALPILLAARADLEIIATQAIGTAQRPLGWNGDSDPTNPDLPIQIRLDLELLAGTVLGEGRPEGWFGVVATVPIGIARDIRHDLELVADSVMGVTTIRPAGWQGDSPIYRCGRATQAILIMLEKDGLTIPVDPTQPDYCQKAEIDAAVWVERNVLQPLRARTLNVDTNAAYPFLADSAFVVAFLDRDARQKIGVLPQGAGFNPLGRSTVGFSNMTLIEGDGFRVYVDWTTTPLTQGQFEALPDFDTISDPIYCDADWCGVNVD
ncbi:MAG: hypothetical protein L6Q98_09395 [Anaerolineae bacterium]|nr:hypothetical protein [Anaerolineae bacterium]NUQ06788.1 hypothetical protein [Anaerolineae bacterium]